MIDFSFQIPEIIATGHAIAEQAGGGFLAPDVIGFVVLAIIVGPVAIITIISLFSPPRTFKMPGLFLGSLILLVGALVSGFAILGFLLGFIVPG